MPNSEQVISTLEEIKTQTAEIGLDSAVIAHKFIDKIIALLKEQEAVKPVRDKETGRIWLCGNCGTYVGFEDNDPNDPNEFDKFCRECGRPVLWKGR